MLVLETLGGPAKATVGQFLKGRDAVLPARRLLGAELLHDLGIVAEGDQRPKFDELLAVSPDAFLDQCAEALRAPTWIAGLTGSKLGRGFAPT